MAEALRGRRPAYRLLVANGIQVDTRIRDILDTAQRTRHFR